MAINQLTGKSNREPVNKKERKKEKNKELVYEVLPEIFNFSIKDSRYYCDSLVIRE
jgi:hypothetical protein